MADKKKDDGFKFDIDFVDPKKKFTTSKQTFSRIRAIKALEGLVLMVVDERGNNAPEQAGENLKTVLMSIKEAATRAYGLNRMLGVVPEMDRDVALAIVEETIAACREAKVQQMDPEIMKKASKITTVFDPKKMEEILGKDNFAKAMDLSKKESKFYGVDGKPKA